MLSLFPNLMFLAPFSPLLIRIALALVFVFAVNKHWFRAEISFKALAVIELAAAVSIGAGALAQMGAFSGMLVVIYWLSNRETRPVSFVAALLSLVLCVSLVLTGAGIFAFDLPL